MLDGFGDAKLGEWTEDRPRAFHLRRRLSEKEAENVGDAVDCRSTAEGLERFEAIKNMLHPQAIMLARQELTPSISAAEEDEDEKTLRAIR